VSRAKPSRDRETRFAAAWPSFEGFYGIGPTENESVGTTLVNSFVLQAGLMPEQREDLVSAMFRACIKVQTQMDRRFRRFRMTAQEASVLIKCVEMREISPGTLAQLLGRDKGKVTQFVQRLVARNLLKRETKAEDRRVAQITPTSRGRALAPQLKATFEEIREYLFLGIPVDDVERAGNLLAAMLANADRAGVYSKRADFALRRKHRPR
jgi:DNA-binding MarR family transcriptional regulator